MTFDTPGNTYELNHAGNYWLRFVSLAGMKEPPGKKTCPVLIHRLLAPGVPDRKQLKKKRRANQIFNLAIITSRNPDFNSVLFSICLSQRVALISIGPEYVPLIFEFELIIFVLFQRTWFLSDNKYL